jgi:hypothetical protein
MNEPVSFLPEKICTKQEILLFIIIGFVAAVVMIGFMTPFVMGSTMSLEPPPPPSLFTNGTPVNLSADDKDRDISIDPTDILPSNGTQTMSTHDATDVDINVFPPKGVTVMIQNDSITVTKNQVSIIDPTKQTVPTSEEESSSNGDEE